MPKGESPTDEMDAERVLRQGVTVRWLAAVMNMNQNTVRTKLSTCPAVGKVGKGYAYAIRDAMRYLVNPELDENFILRNLKKADLPPALSKDVWDARLKELKYRVDAKELWITEDIIEAFTDVFVSIKANVQLWPDTVERQIGLTDEQREMLVRLADELLDSVHATIKERLAGRVTLAAIRELEEEFDSPI